jgi:hypothetical protein
MWIKLGLIFDGQGQLPTVQKIDGGIRVYYSKRIGKHSVICYFETDKPEKAKHINEDPVLTKGRRGCFDDSGVMPSCVYEDNLFYTGWNVDKGGVPYGHGIGCAKIAGDKIERIFEGPVLDRTELTPFLANSPFVDERGMLFCNGNGWKEDFPTYQIALAEMKYGRWQVEKIKLYGGADEACSRPCRFKEKVYFAKKKRDSNYTIVDEMGELVISVSSEGWDSQMVCYPAVFKYCGEWYMYYNGNGFGHTGIGLAKWEE